MAKSTAGIASAIAGSLVPLQAAVNAALADTIGSSIGAAALSMFGSGLLLLPSASRMLTASHMNLGELRAWMVSGGLFGAAYVSSIIVLTRHLGFAALFVAAEAGSMASAMVLDHIGARCLLC